MKLFGDFEMSRSHKKTPIFGHASCHSERQDKKIWHKRWRSRERMTLGSATTDQTEHVTLLRNQVSNTWAMGKDGKSYWPEFRQIVMAERMVNNRGQSQKQCISLKKRLLYKWVAK